MYKEWDGHREELHYQRRFAGCWPYHMAYVVMANSLSVAIEIELFLRRAHIYSKQGEKDSVAV